MLEALIDEQKRLALSDRLFGQSLGVPGRTWCAARLGKRALSPKIVRAAMKAYPHLMQMGVLFLLSGDTDSSESPTIRSKRPSNIDLPASEATRTLVTIACTETAPIGQGGGGSSLRGDRSRRTKRCYVSTAEGASGLASQAVEAEAG